MISRTAFTTYKNTYTYIYYIPYGILCRDDPRDLPIVWESSQPQRTAGCRLSFIEQQKSLINSPDKPKDSEYGVIDLPATDLEFGRDQFNFFQPPCKMSSALLVILIVGIMLSSLSQVSYRDQYLQGNFPTISFPLQANVMFHFSLDFNVKQPSNSSDSSEVMNQTITIANNRVYVEENNKLSNLTNWPERAQYSEAALEHLMATRRAVQQLNQELTPLAGRSNDLAKLLKRTLRYTNEVDAQLERSSPEFAELIAQLRKYIKLVQDLSTPSSLQGGSRTLEFVLLKLAMEKHQLLSTQQEVSAWLQQADEAWTRYQNTQVVLAES